MENMWCNTKMDWNWISENNTMKTKAGRGETDVCGMYEGMGLSVDKMLGSQIILQQIQLLIFL